MSDKKKPEIPPGALAELDQTNAEAALRWGDLVEILAKLTEEYGEYGAMAIMSSSLEVASKNTLISMVVTGMRVKMLHNPKET